MWIAVEMVDARDIKCARAAGDSMDFLSFGKKEFSQTRAVLAGNPCVKYSFI
jgi:hypothetical protein